MGLDLSTAKVFPNLEREQSGGSEKRGERGPELWMSGSFHLRRIQGVLDSQSLDVCLLQQAMDRAD